MKLHEPISFDYYRDAGPLGALEIHAHGAVLPSYARLADKLGQMLRASEGVRTAIAVWLAFVDGGIRFDLTFRAGDVRGSDAGSPPAEARPN